MKTTVSKTRYKARPSLTFPVLMASGTSGRIVIFTDMQKGIDVMNGHYSESWVRADDTGVWQRFEGQVTLEND